MIQLPVIDDRVLIFDVKDAKKIRSLGICGVLGGTLPAAPQQNVFLGLPLQLMPEDVIWLVENGHGVLVDSLSMTQGTQKQAQTLICSPEADSELEQASRLDSSFSAEAWNKKHLINMRDTEQEEKLIKKLEKLSLPEEKLVERIEALKAAGKEKNFVVVPNYGPAPEDQNQIQQLPLEVYIQRLSPHINTKKYHIYRHLRDQGVYLLPGLRFGGDFLGYPNDPLRYHAHYIVKTSDSIGMLDLIAGGRLATGVKKVWVIASESKDTDKDEHLNSDREQTDIKASKANSLIEDAQDSDNTDIIELKRKPQVKCYSIEWAGFG